MLEEQIFHAVLPPISDYIMKVALIKKNEVHFNANFSQFQNLQIIKNADMNGMHNDIFQIVSHITNIFIDLLVYIHNSEDKILFSDIYSLPLVLLKLLKEMYETWIHGYIFKISIRNIANLK